jgi:WD40 repeat protein
MDHEVTFQVLKGHTSDVTSLDFSHSNLLVSASNDKTLRFWKKSSEETTFSENIDNKTLPPSPLSFHKYGVNCVRFSPFDTIVASASTDGNVILWNAQNGSQVVKLRHPSESAIRVCAFSPSCAVLATAGDDESVCLWDISTRGLIRSLVGHEATIMTVSFTPDSNFLISGSTAGDLKLWDARHGHGKCLQTLAEAHDLGVLGCDFSSQYQVDCELLSLFLAFLRSVTIFCSIWFC